MAALVIILQTRQISIHLFDVYTVVMVCNIEVLSYFVNNFITGNAFNLRNDDGTKKTKC